MGQSWWHKPWRRVLWIYRSESGVCVFIFGIGWHIIVHRVLPTPYPLPVYPEDEWHRLVAGDLSVDVEGTMKRNGPLSLVRDESGTITGLRMET